MDNAFSLPPAIPANIPPRPSFGARLSASLTFKFALVAALLVALQIPLLLFHLLQSDRTSHQAQAEAEVSKLWGGHQTLCAPVLKFGAVVKQTREFVDKGKRTQEVVDAPYLLTVLPDELDMTGEVAPEVRTRGIYQIPLHSTAVEMKGTFALPANVWPATATNRTLLALISISDTKGVKSARLLIDGKEHPLRPGSADSVYERLPDSASLLASTRKSGSYETSYRGNSLVAELDLAEWAPEEKKSFELQLRVNGSGPLLFSPMGRNCSLALKSPWPSPSFTGDILPDERSVTDDGFTASWHVMELNRPYPQNWQGDAFSIRGADIGVSLVLPANFYQQVSRCAKYATLFIIIVLVSLLIAERLSRSAVHPLQYVVASLALVMFYMLLLSLAEHMPFSLAYLVSTLVITAMTSAYCGAVFRRRSAALGIGGLMLLAYAAIYGILQLESMALLIGTAILLLLLGALMAVTAKINRDPANG